MRVAGIPYSVVANFMGIYNSDPPHCCNCPDLNTSYTLLLTEEACAFFGEDILVCDRETCREIPEPPINLPVWISVLLQYEQLENGDCHVYLEPTIGIFEQGYGHFQTEGVVVPNDGGDWENPFSSLV